MHIVNDIWETFLTIVKEEAGSRVVETWLKAVSLRQWDSLNKVVYLEAPNAFVRDWIKSNYLLLFERHLGRLFNVDSVKIIFLDMQAAKDDQDLGASGVSNILPAVVAPPKSTMPVKVSLNKTRGYINSAYKFDSFIVGPSNSLARAAAQAVTEKPGTLYNPLFIYGDSGLGKTHLLHAIANQMKIYNPHAVVLYQTADRFVNEFINAIRFDKIHKFQEKYKDIDVLLVDDIQFISNKEQTQEAFFHIFNSLYEAHKQIVFSSDTFPQNIQGLAERLRSRLGWGLVTDIHTPTLETKIAILKKKAELSNEPLADEVAHFIAARVISNIRELEGALVRVMAFSSLTKQPVSLDLARKVMMRMPEHKSAVIDFDSIIRSISKYYPVTLEDLRSKGRNKDLSSARQVAMFFMKKMTDKSLRDIGGYLGGRDHSTVMHALEKVQHQAHEQEEFRSLLKKIEAEIKK